LAGASAVYFSTAKPDTGQRAGWPGDGARRRAMEDVAEATTSQALSWEPVQRSPSATPRELAFRFTGSTSEDFRIWILNTLLTMVTLGIYSAWAKFRSKQYFYRNTWVDGTSFEYLADPVRILKGRLVIAAVLALVFGAQQYSMAAYFVMLAVVISLTPWVL